MTSDPWEVTSIKHAARVLDAHPNSIRIWMDQGRIAYTTTPGGQRKPLWASVEAMRDRGRNQGRMVTMTRETAATLAGLAYVHLIGDESEFAVQTRATALRIVEDASQ